MRATLCLRAAGVVAVALGVAAIGCTVPTDSSPRTLSADEMPSTTTVAEVVAPPPGAKIVDLYYFFNADVDGPEGIDLRQEELANDDLKSVLDQLLADPPEGTLPTPGNVTILGVGEPEDGVVTIDMSAAYREVFGPVARQFDAELVLTATARPGVDAVRFLAEGEPVARSSDSGEAVNQLDACDFLSLLPTGDEIDARLLEAQEDAEELERLSELADRIGELEVECAPPAGE